MATSIAAKGAAVPPPIARVLWKEILPGDRRKFLAQSNNEPQTGGGARDLRFGGGSLIEPVVLAMFPKAVSVTRRRKGLPINLTRYEGRFYWKPAGPASSGAISSEAAFIEPPTTARPSEWRLTRVHTYGVFQAELPPEAPEDRVLLLLIQLNNGEIWPRFTTESSLRTSAWSQKFRTHVLQCLEQPRPSGQAAFGYLELATMTNYCHV